MPRDEYPTKNPFSFDSLTELAKQASFINYFIFYFISIYNFANMVVKSADILRVNNRERAKFVFFFPRSMGNSNDATSW